MGGDGRELELGSDLLPTQSSGQVLLVGEYQQSGAGQTLCAGGAGFVIMTILW